MEFGLVFSAMQDGDLIVFQEETARRQYIRRAALTAGFVDASRLTTFARLRADCLRAARQAGQLARPEPGPLDRALLVRRVAAEAAQQFPSRAPGAIRDTVDSLQRLLAPFGEEADAVRQWLLKKPVASKLHYLGQLYTLYRERLAHAGFCDQRDQNAAILRMLQGDRSAWPRCLADLQGRLLIRAVRWLEPFEERWVETMAERLGRERVRITSALPPTHAEKMEDRLAARIRSEVLSGVSGANWTGWAEDLGDAWAVDDAALAVSSRERVSFLRSASPSGEIEDLARRIRWEMDEQKVPPENIALVLRRPEERAETITRVFKEFGIPWFSRAGRPLPDTAPARLMFAIWRFVLNPDRDRFLALLSSPGLKWPGVKEVDDRHRLVHELQASGLGPGWNIKEMRSRLRHEESLLAFLDRLPRLTEPAAPAELARRARKLLSDFLRGPDSTLSPAAREESGQAIAQMQDILRQAEGISWDKDSLAWNEFVDLLEQAMPSITLPRTGAEEYGVWVMSPAQMAGLSFDVVLIGGLQEGAFPLIPRQDALLDDSEREAIRKALRKSGRDWPQWSLPLSTVRGAQESILFLIGLGAARDRLVLSYPAADEQGREMNPGDFVRALWTLAGDPDETAGPPRPYDAWRMARWTSGSYLEAYARRQAEWPPSQRQPFPGESWWATPPLPLCRGKSETRCRAARLLEERARAGAPAAGEELSAFAPPKPGTGPKSGQGLRVERWLDMEWQREAFFNRTTRVASGAAPYCGVPSGEAASRLVQQWLTQHPQVSPTALEVLANCRFRFLMSQLFRLQPVRLQDDEPDRMDRGTLLHVILEQVYRGLRGDPGQPSDLAPEKRSPFASLLQAKAWAIQQDDGSWRLTQRRPEDKPRSIPLVASDGVEKDQVLDFGRAVCEAVFAAAEAGRRPALLGDPAVWAAEKPKLQCIVENILRLDLEQAAGEKRFPALFELRFGDPKSPSSPPLDTAAVPLGEADRGIRVCGRVDRVDLLFDSEDRLSGLLVLDYKSVSRTEGSARDRLEEVANNTNTQLPVYGFAAQRLLFGAHDTPDLNGLTEVLFHAQERDADKLERHFLRHRLRLSESEGLEKPITHLFKEQLQKNLDRLRRADFAVAPLDCTFCDFANICRVDANALENLSSPGD